MTPEQRRKIASKGGTAAHAQGSAHEWNSEQARKAGRKGGLASHRGEKKIDPAALPDKTDSI